MADKIRLLPESVANQIAAGEVVNRPASVVKEMMENAVDAGATLVTVNFRDGGKELIQIKDDGCGMSPADARLAFDRHATSKITTVDDIYRLHTFGFRGEALASIAAVAQVELQSKPADAEIGTRICINGSTFQNQSPIACAAGSQFFVRNLFYNVPARRRFLDKSTTEANHILTEFQRVALCHPEVAFQLYRDDTLICNLTPSPLLQRIIGVIGKSLSGKLLEVSANTSIVRLSGFVGRPNSAKQRNREQFLFVNGRYFKSPFFHKAVVQAYEKLIPANVQPSYFLYLEIEPESIDVNVHPQKTEVKFSDQAAIWQIIHAAVRETLAKTGAVPLMDFDAEDRVDIPVLDNRVIYHEPSSVRKVDYNPFVEHASDRPVGKNRFSESSNSVNDQEESFPMRNEMSLVDYISEEEPARQARIDEFDDTESFSRILPLSGGYAATTREGGVVIVDLRRARESILYERYLRMIAGGESVTQQLLFPERMALSIDDYTLLEEHLTTFSAAGFDIRTVDEQTIEITGIPAEIGNEGIDEVIYELLDAVRDDTTAPEELRRERLAATLARAGASAPHTHLSESEIRTLLAELASNERRCYTPSGRPVLLEISENEIRNRLK